MTGYNDESNVKTERMDDLRALAGVTAYLLIIIVSVILYLTGKKKGKSDMDLHS
jgi:hypothetical protein